MHNELKWFARISGLVVSVIFLIFLFRKGVPDIKLGTGNEWILFLLFSIPILVGYVVAWFKPYAGGIIIILGALLLASYFVYQGDFNRSMIYGIPALLIGLSFIASVHKELV